MVVREKGGRNKQSDREREKKRVIVRERNKVTARKEGERNKVMERNKTEM